MNDPTHSTTTKERESSPGDLGELKKKFSQLHEKIRQRQEILDSIRLDHGPDLCPEEGAVLDAMWAQRNAILAQIQASVSGGRSRA